MPFAGKELFAKGWGDFLAGQQLDVVLNACVVGNNDAAPRGVTEETHDSGMGTADDANNAALGPACGRNAAEASDANDNRVAMHGVFDVIARNENVAINIGESDVGNDKAVAFLMQNEAAMDFVAGSGFVLGKFVDGFGGSAWLFGRTRRFGGLAKEKTAVGELFDEAAFFQFVEHLQQSAAFVFANLEGAGEFIDGHGIVSNLKKTQDVIGA
jgi:hypothetical protein